MPGLPQSLWTAEQTRALDRAAIDLHGIPAATLMERAGRAAFGSLRRRWPTARRILVVCGSGNNGGDGYVLAAAAREAGLQPRVLALAAPKSDESRAARARAEGAGVPIEPLPAQGLPAADVVVDGVLGTGLLRAPDGLPRRAIELMEATPAPVLALDIASGLSSDTGGVPGVAVRAVATVTFIALKIGLFTGRGREFSGAIEYAGLDVPPQIYDEIEPLALRLTVSELCAWVPRRPQDAHKGVAGHVLVVGGEQSMAGAARMAGAAACRAGAGLVSVATRAAHAAHVSAGCPELMASGIEDREALENALGRASVVALGPGLGRASWGRTMWAAAVDASLPLVVDADALNLLAEQPHRRDDWILTPHPGEAARLLGTSTAAVQADRVAAVRSIVERYGGVCALKGSGTLVADVSSLWVCDRGNAGMATGGMGDVLTGAIAALRAQGLEAVRAAGLGVWLHAGAGDAAAQGDGRLGMMATDLLPHIRRGLNRLTETGG